MTEIQRAFAVHRTSWTLIDNYRASLADKMARYAQEYPNDFAPLPPDALFLEFKRAGQNIVHPKSSSNDWGRPLLKELSLQISPKDPTFIANEERAYKQLCELFPAMKEKLLTRHMLEQEGRLYKDTVLLGANVMLFEEARDGSLSLLAHQRDNHPTNPYPLGYSIPGGIVSERPSLAPAKRLREEFACLLDRGDHYELPYFLLPFGYNNLSSAEVNQEIAALEIQLRRVRNFTKIRYPDTPYPEGFNVDKEIRITPIELAPLPRAADIEGTLKIFDDGKNLIDQIRAVIIDSPQTNHASFAVPAVIPSTYFEDADRYLLDIDNLPFMAAQGGRDIVRLSKKEIAAIVKRGECAPLRPKIQGTFLPTVRSKMAHFLTHIL